MKRPETKDKQYWDGDRFRHLMFIEHLEHYTNKLEQQLKNCNLQNVMDSQFEVYAAFCIELDRQGMKPIKYKDYLEIG